MSFDFDTVYDRTGTDSGKWSHYPPDVLPMYVADMDFRSPSVVIEALHQRVEHGFFGYGREPQGFLEIAAARITERYGWKVGPEAIVPVPGVVVGVNLTAQAFTTPGDGIALQTPAYPPILHCPEKVSAERRLARLVQDESGRYTPDWDEFDAAIDGAAMFILCNPHNPVGRAFERAELQRMGESCLRTGTLMVSDEIHCDLTFPGHPHIPLASLSPEIEARTITFMAPSKTFNLPGLKASIAVIPNDELRERFVAARADLVRGPNILGLTAATAAYKDGGPWLDAVLAYLDSNRDYVTRFIHDEMPGIRMFPPEATYLGWLDCRGANLPDNDPYTFFLEKAKVALNDGPTFGEDGRGFVRLNFACPRSMLTDGLNRMKAALDAYNA